MLDLNIIIISRNHHMRDNTNKQETGSWEKLILCQIKKEQRNRRDIDRKKPTKQINKQKHEGSWRGMQIKIFGHI